MPVTLFSGLPGSGKTAHMVAEIVKLREKEPDRPIYQIGINGLIDGLCEDLTLEQLHKWWELPTGSIIMIDEAQESHLMPKDNGNVPEWIKRISKVRHVGMDFYLTSQRPNFVSSYVRGLVDRHVHFVRKFNTSICQRFTWGSCSENPRSRSEQKMAVEDVIALPSRVFSLYKSANAHNMKRKIPRKVWMLLAAAAVVVCALVAIPYRLKAMQRATVAGAGGLHGAVAGLPGRKVDTQAIDQRMRVTDYAKWQRPRVPGVPWTAPMFDHLQVTAQPRLACMALADGTCHCVTEQGTDFDMDIHLCRKIAAHGLYNPFIAPDDAAKPRAVAGRRDGSGTSSDGREAAPVPAGEYRAGVGSQEYKPPQLISIPDSGLRMPESHS